MRVRIDRDKCVGAENCVVTAPSIFALDADGKARLLEIREMSADLVWLAAELCPTEAIIIEADDGEQLYP